ncbi:hypothetical protein QFC21_003059 [Naganishia friedmannii]|uniref:Uncharacterized protein n=1 Tax=Naganishia friedmannii TaxID=89922 RepID=A0ACC2VRM1_9TREE|nr:hypothetical protein QFC21_003059 [Naganishia friedmannii]
MQTPRQTRQSLIPTPGRQPLPQSGLPTPTGPSSSRRRVSTGLRSSVLAPDNELKAAFKGLMENPSNLLRASISSTTNEETHDTTPEGIQPLSYNTTQTATDGNNAASSRRYQNLGISQSGTPASNRTATNQPRTPSGMSLRPRTASSRVATTATTPSGVASGALRASHLGASTSTATPKRRISNLGTGGARTPVSRPESRQAQLPKTPGPPEVDTSIVTEIPEGWVPEIGTAVRVNSMGFEGIVRWIGKVDGKDGKWAGVELDRQFVGFGKNDGTVDGKRYFHCETLGGVFALLHRLSIPMQRPASVMSHRSAASINSDLPNGRAPSAFSIHSGRDTPFISEDGEDALDTSENQGSNRTIVGRSGGPLTRSTRANVQANTGMSTPSASKYTAGSRASMLVNTNAKQLAAAKALKATDGALVDQQPRASTPSTPGAPLGRSMLAASTSHSSSGSTSTPKPMMRPRQSLSGIATPSRTVSMSARMLKKGPRESLGASTAGGFSTPKSASTLRNGRMSAISGRSSVASNAHDMPPPPSPSKYGTLGRSTVTNVASSAAVKEAEAQVESLKQTNRVLVDKINAFEAENAELQSRLNGEQGSPDGAEKRVELESKLKEAQKQVHEYKIASEFQSREVNSGKVKIEQLEQKLRESNDQTATASEEAQEAKTRLAKAETMIAKLNRDLEVEKQRLEEEFEKGMQAKREEVKHAEDTVRDLQKQLLVVEMVKAEIVNDASQMTTIYEAKLVEAKTRRMDLEKTVRSLEDQLLEAQERRNQAALLPSEVLKEADTAAMIDNENLKAQVAHQQKKIVSLEDQNEEFQVQLEKYDEAAIKANEKARDNERRLKEEITNGRSEISTLKEQIAKHKDRVAELALALKDQGHTLASAQAEIESNRIDLADMETMRFAQSTLTRVQKEKSAIQQELDDLKSRAEEVESIKIRYAQLEDQFSQLTAKHEDLRTKHALALPTSETNHRRDNTSSSTISSSTLSVHSTESEKSIAGFQKIVAELSDENGDLKQKIQDLEREIQTLLADNQELARDCGMLRESLAQLEAAVEDKLAKEEEQLNVEERELQRATSKAADDRLQVEIDNVKSRLAKVETEKIEIERRSTSLLKEHERELQELENLVEAKIYKEDELLRQIEDLTRQLERPGTSLSHTSSVQNGGEYYSGSQQQSRAASAASVHSSASVPMCDLCNGGHLMDHCPLYTSNEADDSPDKRSPSLHRGEALTKTKSDLSMEHIWCHNCDVRPPISDVLV